MRPDAPVQLFLSGHYDTVYEAAHPFQHCTLLTPETLRGPGTADMKGGLVVMLAALQAFEKTPHASRIGYEILLGPDEETGSQSYAPLLETAAKRYRLGLIFEPARANGNLVKSRKGTGIFTLTVHGRAAHAGRDPAAGRNAILALCEILPQVEALTRSLPGVMVNVGSIQGGGAANIVPDRAEAVINARVSRNGDDAVFLKHLHDICAPWHARAKAIASRSVADSTAARRSKLRRKPVCSRNGGAAPRNSASRSTGNTSAAGRTATCSQPPGCPTSTAWAASATTSTVPRNTVSSPASRSAPKSPRFSSIAWRRGEIQV